MSQLYPNDKYLSDPKFQMLVDYMHHMIKRAEFTPTEIREAAMLAMIKYDLENPRPVLMSPEFMEKLSKGFL